MNLPDELRELIDKSRAKVRFGFPWWLRPFLMKDVLAITLGRRIYFAAHAAGEKVHRTLKHELVHVRQVRELGLFRFYWRYISEWIRNLRAGMPASEAYRKISFEVEAYAAEEEA